MIIVNDGKKCRGGLGAEFVIDIWSLWVIADKQDVNVGK